MSKILIDGDIIAYRAGFSTDDLKAYDAESKVDKLIDRVLEDTEFLSTDYHLYLTGKGNFRFDIANTVEYKGNRKHAIKPIHLKHIREYIIKKYEATVSEGEEADDLIAIEATKVGMTAVVASIDKDMLQLPCYHYNITRRELSAVGEFTGLKYFYSQILTGDKSDNIKGLHRCGPIKANKILDECYTEMKLWVACVEAYEGDTARVIENARLLWLRREEDQLWEPPSDQDKIS